jgi:alpha-amylase
MIFRHRQVRAALALLAVLAIAGCGGSSQPTSLNEAATPAAASAPAAAPSAAASPPPAITPSPIPAEAPAATPFPLALGWWDSAVCYEIFVRSFRDSNGDGVGDLNGLIANLDYVNDGDPASQKDLGANCVWLMPIMESPSYHGYDTTDYYKVDQEYGSNDDFKRLVDEAHKRGIKIVLDLVLNHSSNQHPWFKDASSNPGSPYRDWFIWSPTDPGYKAPWGSQVWHKSPAGSEFYYGLFSDTQPDLNYRNPAVTAEAQKISAFWLNDMGADGYRLDAIKHLIEDGTVQENTPETHAWLRGYRAFLEQQAPGRLTVGEIFDATPKVLEPYYPDQLDMYFIFDIGPRIIAAANSGNGRPYLSAANRVNSDIAFERWAPFLTNHDQNRVMGLLGDMGKAKIAATALLTLPGLPFLYYGEEIGMVGAKPDPQIRTPMQWSAEGPGGGFSTGTPWEPLQPDYTTVNVAAQEADAGSLLNLYRRLIHLHTQHPALATGDLTPLESSTNNAVAFLRQAGDETVLVVLNFDGDATSDAKLTLAQSALAAGTYRLEPLLGDQPGAELTVGENGSVADYVPLPSLAPRTGYIFKLAQ